VFCGREVALLNNEKEEKASAGQEEVERGGIKPLRGGGVFHNLMRGGKRGGFSRKRKVSSKEVILAKKKQQPRKKRRCNGSKGKRLPLAEPRKKEKKESYDKKGGEPNSLTGLLGKKKGPCVARQPGKKNTVKGGGELC